jgi:hypothetical protein
MKTPNSPNRWNPWPVSIVAFFVVALIGCGTFVAYCNRHPADLVAADYYEQEVRYQGQIDRLQHAQQAGQAASVSYDPASKCIRLVLPPNSSPAHAAGTIQLYRPSAIKMDRQVNLATDAQGLQSIDAAGLAAGLWKVRVSWTVAQQDYFIDQKLVIGDRN